MDSIHNINAEDDLFGRVVVNNLKQDLHYTKPFKRFLISNLKAEKEPLTIKECYDLYKNQHLPFKTIEFTIQQFICDLSELVNGKYINIYHNEVDYLGKNREHDFWVGLHKWFNADPIEAYTFKPKFEKRMLNKIMHEEHMKLRIQHDELKYRSENR